MSKNDICEALYALPDGVVVKRRKPITIPAALAAAGAALLAVNIWIVSTPDSADIRSAIGLAGAVLLLAGGIVCAVRLFGGDGRPYHTGEKGYMSIEELKFGKDKAAEVARLVEDGDFDSLRALCHDGVSAVTAVICSSPSGRLHAGMAFEFVDLEMRPICGLKIVCRDA